MKQPSTKIAKYLADDTLKHGSSKELSREMAAYLLSENRLNDLDSILRDTQQYWADSGLVEVNAISAFPISPKVEKDIRTKIKKLYPNAKKIIIIHERDENVIAGVRLELANQQLDLSVETKLNKFKQLSVS